MTKKLKVINISGWGRNGSTILGSILGQNEGFFFAGELRNIWKQSLINNRMCGCGVALRDCKTWDSIFEVAFSGINNIEPKKILKLSDKITRYRCIFNILFPFGKSEFLSTQKEFTTIMGKLLLGIQNHTNCKVIVDITKNSLYGYYLSQISDVDLYTIHLIRDPRGIAYSRKKEKIQPDSNQTVYMEKFSPFKSSLLWVVRNLLTELLLSKDPKRYLRVSYSDFANEPKKTADQILEFIDEPQSKTPFISEKEVLLEGNHSVWGNPSRFNKGHVQIKPDLEWTTKLGKADKFISTIVSLPLLPKYGCKIIT